MMLTKWVFGKSGWSLLFPEERSSMQSSKYWHVVPWSVFGNSGTGVYDVCLLMLTKAVMALSTSSGHVVHAAIRVRGSYRASRWVLGFQDFLISVSGAPLLYAVRLWSVSAEPRCDEAGSWSNCTGVRVEMVDVVG